MTELETHLLAALGRLQSGHSEQSEHSQALFNTLREALSESEKQNKELLKRCELLAEEQRQTRKEYQIVQESLSSLSKHIQNLTQRLNEK